MRDSSEPAIMTSPGSDGEPAPKAPARGDGRRRQGGTATQTFAPKQRVERNQTRQQATAGPEQHVPKARRDLAPQGATRQVGDKWKDPPVPVRKQPVDGAHPSPDRGKRRNVGLLPPIAVWTVDRSNPSAILSLILTKVGDSNGEDPIVPLLLSVDPLLIHRGPWAAAA